MEDELPTAINEKLEHTLAQYRSWKTDHPLSSKPILIKRFKEGISNYSFLVGEEKKFVVRIDGVNPKTLGINRYSEWSLLHRVASAGLAPTPRYFNPDLGSLVVDYLLPDKTTLTDLCTIARFLQQLHSLPNVRFRLDIFDRIQRYEQQLHRNHKDIEKKLKPFSGKIKKYLALVKLDKTPAVLCHNDLTRANRISSDSKLWGIDLEYASAGNPWFDIAVVCLSDELDSEKISIFLNSYLKSTDELDFALHQVSVYQVIYRYIETLWYAISLKHAPIDLNLARLEKTLALTN